MKIAKVILLGLVCGLSHAIAASGSFESRGKNTSNNTLDVPSENIPSESSSPKPSFSNTGKNPNWTPEECAINCDTSACKAAGKNLSFNDRATICASRCKSADSIAVVARCILTTEDLYCAKDGLRVKSKACAEIAFAKSSLFNVWRAKNANKTPFDWEQMKTYCTKSYNEARTSFNTWSLDRQQQAKRNLLNAVIAQSIEAEKVKYEHMPKEELQKKLNATEKLAKETQTTIEALKAALNAPA